MPSWKVLSALVLLCPLASYGSGYTWTNTAASTWDTNGNWTGGAAYPGSTGTTDTATFNLTPGVTVTQSGTIPTINGITYASPSGNYTIAGTVGLEFVAQAVSPFTPPFLTNNSGSQIISAPIVLNSTGNSLTITVATVGNNLTLSGGVGDLGTTSVVVASGAGTLINSSNLFAGSNITFNSGSIIQNAAKMTAEGTLTISGGTVTSNNSTTPPFTCNTSTSGPILSGATVTITGGAITLDSSASCGTLATSGVNGTSIQATTNSLTISGGTINATNEAAITATAGFGATGALLSGVGVNISGGSVNLTNSGTISGTPDEGAFLYNHSSVAGVAINFSGGTVIATNNGSVTAGSGVVIGSGTQAVINNPINISGTASVSMINTNGLSTTSAIGASMTGGLLTMSAGALAFNNSGNLMGFPGLGATYGEFFGGITVNGGSLSLSNSGTIGTGSVTGVRVATLAMTPFLQTAGTVSITNNSSGTITAGYGSLFTVTTTSTFSGGTLNCTNNGAINGGNSTFVGTVGSYFSSAGAATFGGTNITLANTGTLSPTGLVSTGSLMNIPSLTTAGTGGTLSLTNSGIIENSTTNTGTYLFCAGTMTLNAGTWTALNTGNVTTGTGVRIYGDGNISLGGTSITMTNDATANVSSGMGCQFLAGQNLSFPSGSTSTLALINNQALTGTDGVGMQGNITTGFTMASGTFNMINSGTVGPSTVSAGTDVLQSAGLFSQTGGTINIFNSGMVSSTLSSGSGVAFLQQGTSGMSLTGGNFNMTNSGALNSMTAGVYGVNVITEGPLTLGGAAVTMTNTSSGSISSPLVESNGCALTGGGITFSSGTWTMTNNGAVSGSTGNKGIFVYNHSASPLTFSGGTVIAINNASQVGIAYGIKITSSNGLIAASPVVVSGGSVTLTNTGNLSITDGLGVYIQGSTLEVSSGSLNCNNTGTLTSYQGAGVLPVFNAVTISGGSVNLLNSGLMNGTGGSQSGVSVLILGSLSQTGGVYSNANSGTNSTATGKGIVTEVVTTTNLSGGTLINTNSGNVNVGNAGVFGNAIGSYFVGSGALNLSGGTMVLSNTGTINASGSAATGSLMVMPSVAATGSAVSMTNAGIVETFNGNIGTSFVSSGAMSLSAGTWAATNTGIISTGTGVEMNGEATITLSGGSFSFLNDVTAGVSGTGIGCQFIAGNTLSLLSGTSTFILQNNQSLSSGTGVLGTIPNITAISPAVTMSAGTFNIANTAALNGTATGAALQVSNGSFAQTGGTFTVSNSGTNAGSGNASYIQAPAITVSGTGTFNNPNALVAATTLTINAGGVLQSGTATVPGVFQDASFGSTANITNDGGTFVSGTLDPTPGQTTINGTFTQNAGTYTVVIGDLNLPSHQGISFLTVNGTAPTGGIVNLDGGILNVISATGFDSMTDIPFGLNKVQFIQASSVINGVFTPLKINNSVPGLFGMTYETIAGNQGWLFFNRAPLTMIPSSSPLPYQQITITTINMINTFLGRELLRMQDDFIARDEEYQYESVNLKHKKHHHRRRNSYSSSLANLSLPQSRKGSGQTIADPILAADPKLAFVNYRLQTEQEQLASEVSSGNNVKPWNVYFGPLGEFGSIHNKHSQLGAHYRSAGGLAGFDYRFSQVGVGLLVDYENVKAKLHKHGGEFWINQFHATGYTTYVPKSFPQFALNGMLGAGGAWYNIHRNILGVPHESTKANSRGAEVDALIGADYLFSHCQIAGIPRGLEIAPMLNLQYIYQGVGSYKEHGSDIYDLKFHKQGFQSLRSTLGTWLQYIWSWKNFSFTPLINIAWQREYLDPNHKVLTTPIHLPAPSGSITIFGAGRDTLLAGLDLLFEFYDTYGVEASYDFEYNSLYLNHGFYVGFNVRF